ncbi:MAG: alanine dehydrogenase [bacterium]
MIVGVIKEIKANEHRVALAPSGVDALVKNGHSVLIEKGSGLGSGISDEDFIQAGAKILNTPQEVVDKADMIVKVKEPLPAEYDLFKENQILFTYLHLAAEPKLTEALIKNKVTSIAYETIQDNKGNLPLLQPMSEVAGRMAVQIGAQFLEKHYGGSGILLGGVPGIPTGKVVIIGGGIVGLNSAKMAVGLGADVTIMDISLDRLRYIDDIFAGRVKTLHSNPYNIAHEAKTADLLIGAVLIPGAKAPHLVTEDMVKTMKKGSVIVDVAIDQGGSVETIDRVTTHENPVFEKHGVLHYSVANIPGAVARSSTFALTNATLPYVLKLAKKGLAAVKDSSALAKGVNVLHGSITCQSVAESLGKEYTPLEKVLGM